MPINTKKISTPPLITAIKADPHQTRPEKQKHRRALIRGRALIGLGFVMLVLFGLVMAAVLLLDPLVLDVPITREVQSINFGPVNLLLLAVSAPGFSPQNFILPVIVILGVTALKRVAEASFLALASVATGTAELVKAMVHRGRPSADLVHVIGHPQTYSFPSGHVTQYTLFFGFGFYLLFTLVKPGLARSLLLALCAGMILLVGPSRIWMGQHWASDVLGGYTLGFGLLLVIIWAFRGLEERRLARQASK